MAPFRSKAQARKLAVLTAQGKFSQKAFQEWAESTVSWKSLPDKIKKQKHGTSKK